MDTTPIEAGSLVIGAGAAGMAFAGTLLAGTDARIVTVDRQHQPGGHWNAAYSFARLHQPSSSHGVDPHALGRGAKDTAGLDQGLYELASGPEVPSHFDQVRWNRRFLASGRLRYFPMCDMAGGDDTFEPLPGGQRRRVEVRGKRVDATCAATAVPSTHAPKYPVAGGVRCVPLNDLPTIGRPPSGYVVVGAGKTGIDACLWLLRHGAVPAGIRWIMPRDAWLLDRANVQPGQRHPDVEKHAVLQRYQQAVKPALANLPRLLRTLA